MTCYFMDIPHWQLMDKCHWLFSQWHMSINQVSKSVIDRGQWHKKVSLTASELSLRTSWLCAQHDRFPSNVIWINTLQRGKQTNDKKNGKHPWCLDSENGTIYSHPMWTGSTLYIQAIKQRNTKLKRQQMQNNNWIHQVPKLTSRITSIY